MRSNAPSFLPPHLRRTVRERRPHLNESFVRATKDGGSKQGNATRMTHLLDASPTETTTSLISDPVQSPHSTLGGSLGEHCDAQNKTHGRFRCASNGLKYDEQEGATDLESESSADSQPQANGMNDVDQATTEEIKKLGRILLDHDTSLVKLTENIKAQEPEIQLMVQQINDLKVASQRNTSTLQFFMKGLADLLTATESINTGHANPGDETMVGSSSPATSPVSYDDSSYEHDSSSTNDFVPHKSTKLNYDNTLNKVQTLSEDFQDTKRRSNTQKLDLAAVNQKVESAFWEKQVPTLYQRLDELTAKIDKFTSSSAQKSIECTRGTMDEEDLAVQMNNLEIKVTRLARKNCHPSYPED